MRPPGTATRLPTLWRVSVFWEQGRTIPFPTAFRLRGADTKNAYRGGRAPSAQKNKFSRRRCSMKWQDAPGHVSPRPGAPHQRLSTSLSTYSVERWLLALWYGGFPPSTAGPRRLQTAASFRHREPLLRSSAETCHEQPYAGQRAARGRTPPWVSRFSTAFSGEDARRPTPRREAGRSLRRRTPPARSADPWHPCSTRLTSTRRACRRRAGACPRAACWCTTTFA